MNIHYILIMNALLLSFINADTMVPMPDHCNIVTFNNLCVNCEDGFNLNTATNTCLPVNSVQSNPKVENSTQNDMSFI